MLKLILPTYILSHFQSPILTVEQIKLIMSKLEMIDAYILIYLILPILWCAVLVIAWFIIHKLNKVLPHELKIFFIINAILRVFWRSFCVLGNYPFTGHIICLLINVLSINTISLYKNNRYATLKQTCLVILIYIIFYYASCYVSTLVCRLFILSMPCLLSELIILKYSPGSYSHDPAFLEDPSAPDLMAQIEIFNLRNELSRLLHLSEWHALHEARLMSHVQEKIRLLCIRAIELSMEHRSDIGDERFKALDKIFDVASSWENILDLPDTVYSSNLEKSSRIVDLRITSNRYYLHILHRSNIPDNIKSEVILLKNENNECLNIYKASKMMGTKNEQIKQEWISKSRILQQLIAARENNTNS